MLASRFWYVVLSLVVGGAVFVLYLAVSMFNRAGARAMGEGLSSDSQVVSWYLKDDARQRSAQLINFALDADIAKYLDASSKSESKVPASAQDKVRAALRRVHERIPKEESFDAVFAVDQHGRVVAHLGYEQATGMTDFELGGYPVVADALHGYIRDDTLVLDRLYRVVARPVEHDVGQMPAGAIVGARIMDDRFARELSTRTGAAVAFYANGQRVSSGAPEGFNKAQLDQLVTDLDELAQSDAEYREKGRSNIRTIGTLLGVQYSRLPGEAWDLGAGYAVARLPQHVDSPLGFFEKADDKDKADANVLFAGLIALGGAALGLAFSFVEYSRPLSVFRGEAERLAKGELDQLAPSRFRGAYRKIAADLNDGLDKLTAKGGAPRRAADLKQVLGDLPDQPQMSAFSLPGDAGPASSAAASQPQASQPRLPQPPPKSKPLPKAPPARTVPGAPASGNGAHAGGAQGDDELAEWRQVYQDFVTTKQQCGENVDGFTYEKFEQTLRKNRDALVQRHGASQVKFSVYVKDGKAALKASPIRDA